MIATITCRRFTVFDVFFGNLYHLNAEQEPEDPDYPKNPQFKERFGPRGVLRCVATPSVNPAPPDPRFGPWGKQTCEDTGPLTIKRMETVDDELTRQGLRPISVNLTETESDALPFRFGQAFCNFMPIAESLL